MNQRRRNLIVLIVVVLLTAVLTVLAFTGFSGTGIYKLVPMYKEMKGALDFSGGRVNVYQIEDEAGRNAENQKKDIDVMQKRIVALNGLKKYGWPEVTGLRLYSQGADKIRVEAPYNIRSSIGALYKEQAVAETMEYISSPGVFTVETAAGMEVLKNEDFVGATAQQTAMGGNGYVFGHIVLELTEQGQQKLAEVTVNATDEIFEQSQIEGETGEDPVAAAAGQGDSAENQAETQPGLKFVFKLDGAEVATKYFVAPFTGMSLAIPDQGMDMASATRMAETINIGPLSAALAEVSLSNVTATQGSATLNKLLFGVLFGLAIALVLILIVYRAGGVASDLALLIFGFLIMLGYSTIPSAIMTPAGVLGMAAAVIVAVVWQLHLLEAVSRSCNMGATAAAAAAQSLKSTVRAVLDGAVLIYLGGAACIFWGGEMLKDFAVVLLIGISFALVAYFIGYGLLALMGGIDSDAAHYRRMGSKPIEKTSKSNKKNKKNRQKA